MIKKLLSLLLCFSLFGNYVFADELPSIHAIKKGNSAPFDGILYNYQADAIVHTSAEYSEQICQKNNEFELKKKDIQCEFDKKQGVITTDKNLSICVAEKEKLIEDKKDLLGVIDKFPRQTSETDYKLTIILSGVALAVGATAGVLITYYNMR